MEHAASDGIGLGRDVGSCGDVGEGHLVFGGFVRAYGAFGRREFGDVVAGAWALVPEGTLRSAGAECSGVEPVSDGVSVSGLGACEVEPAVEFTASVGMVGFEGAGRACGGACAADAASEFAFGLDDGVEPILVPTRADG